LFVIVAFQVISVHVQLYIVGGVGGICGVSVIGSVKFHDFSHHTFVLMKLFIRLIAQVSLFSVSAFTISW
jgi:hypothetical protein